MNRLVRRRLALVVCVSALTGLSGAALGQTRQFQNWVVGCDNAHVCTAIGFTEPSKAVAEPGVPFVEIRRQALRGAPPEIRIVDPGSFGRSRDISSSAARLTVTPIGAELAKGPSDHAAEFEGAGGFRFRSTQAWGVLAALRSRAPVSISIGTKRNLRLPKGGLEPALAYMDEQQDLAGTSAARVRKPQGRSVERVHPTPPEPETVEGAAFGEEMDSAIERKDLPATPRCWSGRPEDTVQGYSLRGTAALMWRDCDSDGGNAISTWFFVPDHRARAEFFVWPGRDGAMRRDGAVLANAEVLPAHGLVRAVRYRAKTQDCGVAERWAFTKAGAFRLIERREMPVCRTAGPAHWIVTYRANHILPD